MRYKSILPIILVIIILLVCQTAVAINITGPVTITAPGTYYLTNDITHEGAICIKIITSDVVFDGMGHCLIGVNSTDSIGIDISKSEMLSNITISNVKLLNWDKGVSSINVNHLNLSLNLINQTKTPIYCDSIQDASIQNNVIHKNSGGVTLKGSGIYVQNNNISYNELITGTDEYNPWDDQPIIPFYPLKIEGSNNEISNNEINSNSVYVGVGGSGGRSVNYAIFCQGNNNLVQNNVISNNDAQIYGGSRGTSNAYCYGIYNSGNFSRISDNGVFSNKAFGSPYPSGKYRVVYGIYSMGSNNSISLNNVYENLIGDSYGIFIYDSESTMVNGNEASNNSEGIHLQSSRGAQLSNNTVSTNSQYGVLLRESDGNTLNRCNIWDNNKGLAVVNSNSNIFFDNYFNNTLNAESDTSTNIWNSTLVLKSNVVNGPYIGGNVWAKPDGTGLSQTQEDVNHNGISIFGYPINGDTIDYLPLLLSYQPHTITVLPGQSLPPTDPDGDGLYEDLNGNGSIGFGDIVLFFQYIEWIKENEPVFLFDFSGNGVIGFQDVVVFFNQTG